ncbi:MAG: hypothetical protein RR022_05245, partial [Angelakisella sp.]
EPERLEQLHAMLAEGSSIASPSKRKSIGLENVNKRLVLFYGENSRLNIRSHYGHYTMISFTIPINAGNPS